MTATATAIVTNGIVTVASDELGPLVALEVYELSTTGCLVQELTVYEDCDSATADIDLEALLRALVAYAPHLQLVPSADPTDTTNQG